MDTTHIIVLVMMLATLLVLIVGVISMMRGGDSDRKNSVRLMTLRVWLQAATIALLGVMFLMSK